MISSYQAFPLLKGTISGTLTDIPLENKERILHTVASGDVTLAFPDSTTVTFTLEAGVDVVLDGGAVTVSTTAPVLLS